MTWSYIAPSLAGSTDRDKVRFLIGDTVKCEPLVMDEEIDFALSEFSDTRLAAAMVLRAMAAKCTREVSITVGDVSVTNVSSKASGYLKLAAEFDPNGWTIGTVLALPSFGGLSLSEKTDLDSDSDAVQPEFIKKMDDIPEGPPR